MSALRLNLINQPMISLDQAEVVGFLNGIIIDGFQVISAFSKSSNINFIINFNEVRFGPDAVIIKNCSLMIISPSNNYKYMSSLSDIYNSSGEMIGKLSGIEIDSQMKITKLYAGNREIDIFEVINIGAVIIVDEKLTSVNVNKQLANDVKESKVINYLEPKLYTDMKQQGENNVAHEEFDIDKKYTYLLGKKLAEELCIYGNNYNKGHTIDILMIKEALDNNLIVNLIMSAEE